MTGHRYEGPVNTVSTTILSALLLLVSGALATTIERGSISWAIGLGTTAVALVVIVVRRLRQRVFISRDQIMVRHPFGPSSVVRMQDVIGVSHHRRLAPCGVSLEFLPGRQRLVVATTEVWTVTLWATAVTPDRVVLRPWRHRASPELRADARRLPDAGADGVHPLHVRWTELGEVGGRALDDVLVRHGMESFLRVRFGTRGPLAGLLHTFPVRQATRLTATVDEWPQ